MAFQQQKTELDDGTILDVRITDCLMICRIGNRATLQAVFMREERALLIGDVFVEPEYRRQGLGTLLLNAAEETASRAGMETLRGNVTEAVTLNFPFLIAVFRKKGFEVVPPFAEYAQIGIEKRISPTNPSM